MKPRFKRQEFYDKFTVYQMFCQGNSKRYIGITDDFKRRFAVHWNDAKEGNTVLCRTIRKYGKDSFIISKIDRAKTWDEACEKEKYYIKLFNTRVPKGMNMTAGGEGINGLVHSEKTKVQMRASHLGKGVGKDNGMFGKPGSMLGKKWTKEQRKGLSESCMGRIPWNKGKECPQLAGEYNGFYKGVHTEETLKKISDANKNIPWSEETRQKILKEREGTQVGIKHSQCKLTENDVIEIRRLYKDTELSQKEISYKFSITPTNVSCIVSGKSWSHIKQGIMTLKELKEKMCKVRQRSRLK